MATKKQRTTPSMKVLWALLCKSVSVDRQSNNISLFNILEELTINRDIPGGKLKVGEFTVNTPTSFPEKTQVQGEFTLVVQLEKELSSTPSSSAPELRIQMLDPDGSVFVTDVLSLTFEKGKSRLRAIVSFNAIIVKDPGIYHFAVAVRTSDKDTFRTETRVPLAVKIFE